VDVVKKRTEGGIRVKRLVAGRTWRYIKAMLNFGTTLHRLVFLDQMLYTLQAETVTD